MYIVPNNRHRHMEPARKVVAYFTMSLAFGMILLLFFGCVSTPRHIENVNAPGNDDLIAYDKASKYVGLDGDYYIDSIIEAQRLFTEEITGVMEVIAKDVKIQVEFNEDMVLRYRLIGYENRDIDDDAFASDTTDAGEIGAGHKVTALYEVELADNFSGELAVVHLRYKLPYGTSDIILDVPFDAPHLAGNFASSSSRFQFIVGVAEFAEILRGSPFATGSLAAVEELIMNSIQGSDQRDTELLELLRRVQVIVEVENG